MLNLLQFGAVVKGTFQLATEEASLLPWISKLLWQTTSDSATETYASLGSAPRMKQWDGGPRAIEGVSEHALTVPNIDWQDAVEISEPDFRRGKHGEFLRLVSGLATAAMTHPNELMLDRIKALETTLTAYDGQLYFDTDHLTGDSGVQSNKLTKNIVDANAPTVAEFRDAVFEAIVQQLGFLNDRARPFSQGGGGSFLVLIPLNLMQIATAALFTDTIQGVGGAVDNSLQRLPDTQIELVTDATLNASWGDATKQFALFRTDGIGDAMVLQEEVPVYSDTNGISDRSLFDQKKFVVGARRSYNILGLNWNKAVLTIFS